MKATKPAGKTPAVADGKRQVDAYIAAAPKAAQPMLRQLRRLVRSSVPRADERLSYQMPYYSYHGRLVYFAAFSKHIGVYIMGRSKARFSAELKPYQSSKATLRFPLGSKLPLTLLRRVIVARAKENAASAPAGRGKAPPPKRSVAARPKRKSS